MNLRAGEAEDTVRGFCMAYFVERDLERSLGFLTEDALWVGTGRQEISKGRKEIGTAIQLEFEETGRPYRITFQEICERSPVPDLGLILCRIHLQNGDSSLRATSAEIRMTFSCVALEEGCRISSIHTSVPYIAQESGSYSVIPFNEVGMEQVDQRINLYSSDIMGRNIPGGIISCYLDKSMPLHYVNEQMLQYLGFQYDEFVSVTHGCIRNIIHAEDFAGVWHAMEKAMTEEREYEVRYRMRKKDGDYIWVNAVGKRTVSEDGRSICLGTIRDVTAEVESACQLKEMAEEQRQQAQQYNQLFQSVLCGIVQYRLTEEKCVEFVKANQESIRILGYSNECFWRKQTWEIADLIYEPDRPKMIEEIKKLCRVGDKMDFQFRLLRLDKSSCWIVGCSEIISDVDGAPLIQSVFLDIDGRKRAELRSRRASQAGNKGKEQLDNLTGLYNRRAGELLIREYLSKCQPQECCALMLLDMDDFGKIQQKEGLAFGDVILQEVAELFQHELGAEDIVVRLGGDEFMLLVKACTKERAAVLGSCLASRVQELFPKKEAGLYISISIGICVTSVTPEYDYLYRCAESTLKYVKEHGKGRAACYLDVSKELGTHLTQLYTEEHMVNEIGSSARKEEDLISLAFELLGKAHNLNDAIFLLFFRIGRQRGYDRVSILETNRAYLSYRFTYQWARNPADLEMGKNIYATQDEFDYASNMYDEEGLCTYNLKDDVSRFPSCLHAGIWNYGIYVGSMSFEVEQKDYAWTEEERRLLKELVKIVYSFILKARSDATSQAKTAFLSRMSHEIRTPMNAISGMTAVAKSVLDDREKAMDCLNKIESANKYLLGLINDILDMSRIESGKMTLNLTSTDPAQLFQSLDSLLRAQAEQKGISLVFDNRYKGGPVQLDGLRLNQVMVNIIGNAIKFTETGGSITVRLDPAAGMGERIKLRFSVADSGAGIAADALSNIFNTFEQAAENIASRYGGTGLGLSISSSLVQMMGGVLEVKSELGKGSEFYFTLSLKPGEESCENLNHAKSEITSTYNMDFSNKRILLVEDNEVNREIALFLLQSHGFIVECAEDGRKALECFESQMSGYYDAILMDIQMPVMDGLEATRRIRTLGRPDSHSVPIIAMTANAFDEDSRKSLESGMNGHLSKPFEVEQLLSILAECMDPVK